MIVVKTEMTQMPTCCKECDKRIYTFVYEQVCKETLKEITNASTKLDCCPLVEIINYG